MDILQQSGLVPLYDYQQVEKLELYKEMERSSERFRQAQSALVGSADPFHQWSRRWEYPWVAAKLPRKGVVRILDAGCGLTFFPFYLVEQNQEARIDVLDSERKLEKAYGRIGNPRVQFSLGGLQSLPYPDVSFDALFCISVLEHTKDFEAIASEFHRVLKPGGLALVTFDICLNGVADLSPRGAEDLLRVFGKTFRLEDPSAVQVGDLRRPSGLVRTEWIRKNKPSALPWRWPKLSALKAGLSHGKLPKIPDLTFCTLSMIRD